MIHVKAYQKYFLLATALIFSFIILGFFFSSFLMKSMGSDGEFSPPLYFAHIIDRLDPEKKVGALKDLESWNGSSITPRLILLNENGEVLYPENTPEILNWKSVVKPIEPYDFVYINSRKEEKNPFPFFLGPPRPPIPDALVKLQGIPTRFLLIGAPEFGKNKKGGMPFFPLVGLGSLVLSLLLGVGTTIAIIYSGVRKGVAEADQVISELHKGNLKARFKVRRRDEFGQAMMRFNTMAEEIEKLVLNLKEVDRARTRLLQELAHDLRTPISSLKNLVENLHTKRQKFTEEIQNEMMELAIKEIYYFERLVEDLLLLAQIKEPSLQNQYPQINVCSVLQETADDICSRYQHQGKNIALNQHLSKDSLNVHADLHLITRLFRNALENSFSFASSSVTISAKENKDGQIEVLIEDDGPGFGDEALATFGTRRVTRKLDTKPNGQLSVGLGSVVMKTIVEALGGQIRISNRKDADRILGGKVEIFLPLITLAV